MIFSQAHFTLWKAALAMKPWQRSGKRYLP